MSSKYYTFKGKLFWTQNITNVDEFRGSRRFKCNLVLDEENQKIFDESGIQTKPYTDKEGNTYRTFNRPEQKIINGSLVEFGPPEYVDKDGNPVTVPVANGSEGEVHVVVYDTQMGKGHRLNKVVVTNLIEYTPDPEAEISKEQNSEQKAAEAAAFE